MPHQCLNCGKVLEDGSPHLLKGCPECGGKRFFYIKEPLSDEEREKIKTELENKIEERFAEILKNNAKGIDLKDIKKFMYDIMNKERSWVFDKDKREKKIKELMETVNENPETIVIEEPGRYRLNLKGLLDEEPIIIEKNGSYIIHLPSLFLSAGKKEKE